MLDLAHGELLINGFRNRDLRKLLGGLLERKERGITSISSRFLESHFTLHSLYTLTFPCNACNE